MKKITLLLMMLIPFVVFPQNEDSYFAQALKSDIYSHFDTLGVNITEEADNDICVVMRHDMKITIDRKYKKIRNSDLLDEVYLSELVGDSDISNESEIIKNTLLLNRIEFKYLHIDIKIKRIKVKYNIFKLKYVVTYQSIIDFNYK